MAVDAVSDEELLYRSVSPQRNQCPIDASTGKRRLSSQAFSDATFQISVDRAAFCGNDPTYTQFSPRDGVVGLIAGEVRAIDGISRNDDRGRLIRAQVVDVVPDPVEAADGVEANQAHALIFATPDFDNRSVFRKLLERLNYLAEARGWIIEPKEE